MTNKEHKYYIYVLLTEQNTYYCGYTNDVEARFQKHLSGQGAKYTKSHKPIKIVYTQDFSTKSDAMKAEKKFKSLSRQDKEKIIKGDMKFI